MQVQIQLKELSPASNHAYQRLDEEVRRSVRDLFGLGLNPDLIPVAKQPTGRRGVGIFVDANWLSYGESKDPARYLLERLAGVVPGIALRINVNCLEGEFEAASGS